MKNESAIQQECFMWFTNEFCLKHHDPRFIMFSIPNEGKSLTEQMRKKQMGMLPGASDTVIVLEDRVIFCEFKDGKGKQSDKQKDFEQRVKSLNHEYWLIRSFEEFKEKIYDL